MAQSYKLKSVGALVHVRVMSAINLYLVDNRDQSIRP